MTPVDLNKIMQLKQMAMKRCEERIQDAAKRSPCSKRVEPVSDYGVTLSLKRKHGL